VLAIENGPPALAGGGSETLEPPHRSLAPQPFGASRVFRAAWRTSLSLLSKSFLSRCGGVPMTRRTSSSLDGQRLSRKLWLPM
jgi:hypothetical protein